MCSAPKIKTQPPPAPPPVVELQDAEAPLLNQKKRRRSNALFDPAALVDRNSLRIPLAAGGLSVPGG